MTRQSYRHPNGGHGTWSCHHEFLLHGHAIGQSGWGEGKQNGAIVRNVR